MRNYFSAVIFGECHLFLYRQVSLGLSIDYISAPAEALPASAISALPAQEVQLGNSSISLLAGFHF